ncbi:putative ATP-dependent permease ADP1 [Ascoidea rubescens DSM 1968]|uniref:Putative ATP-dependent permease of the ABC transporter family of protein n=1 Tax=Ascoidea rubescens DSM 1968 TaxID=1344418 RepID=A0A1D2VQL2_9ASCO|nr:putative ATP-dependent permease of the ABC transporter family of protein [Ascoidea rubescens DSM 1968]ODV63903.1 putative ATP-dependent permease of the ABC transporter family of protein [Ascoidea rubescens DSM 1968]
MLPLYECKQFSKCNEYSGQCECRDGFGGVDCSQPLCGALSDGNLYRPIRNDTEGSCDCKEGWSGINCNLCLVDDICDPFMPDGLKGTCYKNGMIVNKFNQMCDVTNKKIVQILQGKKPQVTFSCNKTSDACEFQFWIAERESFYCDLSNCEFEYDLLKNKTHYNCKDARCKCLPDRMLCGEDGSIDISDFLTETIKGPGDFSCDLEKKTCIFSEPSMNDLISNVFGDPYITLHCESGECIHYSQIPGYHLPEKKKLSIYGLLLISLSAVGTLGFFFLAVQFIKKSPLFNGNGIELNSDDDDESNTLINNHIPVSLTFENVSYSIIDKSILKNVFGYVKPREMLAIMGGSGAGKTTLLDILAGKNKDGTKSGKILINGQELNQRNYKKIIGFVDQEDYLIPTLTVYETVLNSALLRLPRSMSIHAKKLRVLEVLSELRILGIKDRIIGSDFQRGISGGEKRRVAIACELVTSPSILFLDEPTSGLDSYNARKVVECLVRLSRDYQRTIVFTIHQPRSNVVALFDKLLLLSEGNVVYSGDMIKCNDVFANMGYKCPNGYNIADYLIDITSDSITNNSKPSVHSTNDVDEENLLTGNNEERDIDLIHSALARNDTATSNTQLEWAHYAAHREEIINLTGNHEDSTSSSTEPSLIKNKPVDGSKLSNLFNSSVSAEEIHLKIENINKSYIENTASLLIFKNNYLKATIFNQVIILCSRTFKNLYRNPRLLLLNYILNVLMAFFIGFLYFDVSNDISGFQNRLGLFFFVLSFFGFTTLTGLHSFSIERIIFLRERSNNYYHTVSYFISKILCDVLPLRLFPPIILLCIVYPLVGLNMENNGFIKCCIILILFNLTTSMETLIIGILIKESGNATMIGVLVLLFSMLFSGLFINNDSLTTNINWLKYLSTFHYGYESLTINEVKSLILRETKYGINIEIPGATILSTFGFNVAHLWMDIYFLIGWFFVFLTAAYLSLHFFVVERR